LKINWAYALEGTDSLVWKSKCKGAGIKENLVVCLIPHNFKVTRHCYFSRRSSSTTRKDSC